MAARLQESYAGLEQKVEERTRELATALERAGREEPRARGGEPAQVGVPGEHVARAADAAERDHRLLAGAARAAVRRGEREAGGVPRRHPHLGQPPARADQRHPRPVQGRGRADRARGRAVLAAGGARARRRDGARAGDEGRRPGRARDGSGGRHRHGRRAPDQAGDLQPALERREVHARGRRRRRAARPRSTAR